MPTVMNKDVPLGNLASIIVINFMSLGVHDRSERVLASDYVFSDADFAQICCQRMSMLCFRYIEVRPHT